MDALTLLHSRNSAPKLTEPGPDQQTLSSILGAALRAPDHARLRPWRFLTIAGDARNRLGDLFVIAGEKRKQAKGEGALLEQEEQKYRAQPLRAPLMVVVIGCIKEHPKVPAIEQMLSAGCAAHAILLAAQAHGFAGIWRTGDNAFDEVVKEGLGLAVNEEIVGFLYIGSIDGHYKPLATMALEDYCQLWQG